MEGLFVGIEREDSQGVRNLSDLERKYNLSNLMKNLEIQKGELVKLENELNNTLSALIINLNGVIGNQGEVSLWFFFGVPGVSAEPENLWTTTELKDAHIGDLYYDKGTGKVYQYQTDYTWIQKDDLRLIQAMALTSSAVKEENERKIYFERPSPPFANGDWWIQENGDLWVCQITRGEGYYADNDFIASPLYNPGVNSATSNQLTIVSGAITTIRQNADSISQTVASNVQSIDDITGEINTIQENYSTLNQTAQGLSLEIGVLGGDVNTAQATANTALTNASTAQTTANTASANATTALNTLSDIASDSKLTPSEKSEVRKEWDILAGEKANIEATATSYAITTEKTAYTNAYVALGTYLNNGVAYTSGVPSWISDANLGTTTTIVGATFRTNFQTLYTARQTLLNKISLQAQTDLSTAQANLKNYVASRGENLLTNGTGLLGDATNFTGYTFDKSEAYGSAGSFTETLSITRTTDEFMPVNPDLSYRVSLFAKALKGNPSKPLTNHYMFLAMYDSDKLNISANNIMWIPNTLTTLAQDLVNGDTVVKLTNAINYKNAVGSATSQRAFIFWDYKNTGGYLYPPLTYSRNVTAYNTWSDGGVNFTTNEITLNAPWSGGAKLAGTQVSNASSGGSYSYGGLNNTAVPEAWTAYSALWSGIDLTGTNASGKFRPGTAYVKIGWLNHYGAGQTSGTVDNNKIYYSNISFGFDSADKTTVATAQTTANTASTNATTALNTLSDLASDNKLTPLEKSNVKLEWDIIVSEKTVNDTQADTFGVTTEKTNYGTAYTTLSNYITPLLANLTTTSDIVGSTFRANFKDYYDKRTLLLNAISAKAKTLADTAQASANTKAEYDQVASIETTLDGLQTSVNLNKTAIGANATLINQKVDATTYLSDKTATDTAIGNVETSVGVVSSSLSALDSKVSGYDGTVTNVKTNFIFDANGIEIGKSDSAYKMRLSNTSLEFKDGNVAVASINTGSMTITDAILNNSAKVGKHKIEKLAGDITIVRFIG